MLQNEMRRKYDADGSCPENQRFNELLMSPVVIKLMKDLCTDRLAGFKRLSCFYGTTCRRDFLIKFVHKDQVGESPWLSFIVVPRRAARTHEKFIRKYGFPMMEINYSLHFPRSNFEVQHWKNIILTELFPIEDEIIDVVKVHNSASESKSLPDESYKNSKRFHIEEIFNRLFDRRRSFDWLPTERLKLFAIRA